MLIRTSAAKAAIALYAMLAATAATAQSASIIGGRARCDIPDVAHTQAALTDTALYGGQVVNGGSLLQAVQLLRFDALSGDRRVLRTILSSNTTVEATFAVAPRNADVIYAVDNQPPTSTVYSVIKTVDRGASWTPVRTLACLPRLRTGPFGQSVIVACDGLVEISTDGGATWRSLPQGGYAFSRTSDATLFRYASSPRGAVHRSDDGGLTFVPAAMRRFVPQVGSRFEPDANDPATLYFLTYGNTGFHYQFSRNGGNDWTTVGAWPGSERFAVAGTTGTLYTRSLTGPLLRSRDWRDLGAAVGFADGDDNLPAISVSGNRCRGGRRHDRVSRACAARAAGCRIRRGRCGRSARTRVADPGVRPACGGRRGRAAPEIAVTVAIRRLLALECTHGDFGEH